MELLPILEEVGLKENEAKVYLSLLKSDEATATQVSNESKIERTSTYKILEQLIEKGLVTYNIQNKKRHFYPANPERILEELKEKEQHFKEVLPSLSLLTKPRKKDEVRIEIYKGKESLKGLIREILILKQDYVSVGGGVNFGKLFPYLGRHLMKQLEKYKIVERVIVPEGTKITLRSKYSQFRYLPKQYPLLGGFGVFGNKVGFFTAVESPLVVTIENENFAKTFRNYFELLWKIAKK